MTADLPQSQPEPTLPSATGATPPDTAPPAAAENAVVSRREQYLVARKTAENLPLNVNPIDFELLSSALDRDPDVTVVKTLHGPRTLDAFSTLASGGIGAEPIFVAQMSEARFARLRGQIGEVAIVERDEPLALLPVDAAVLPDPGLVPLGEQFTLSLTVLGDGGPVAGAAVYLFGSLLPAQGVTDATGQVTLTLFGESGEAMQALYVKPRDTYWSLWLDNPTLRAGANNTVRLTALGQTVQGFPGQQVFTWGQRAMHLHELPPGVAGRGVRVAVIDSGVDSRHPDLQAAGGYDFVASSDRTWNEDSVGHGSHCAGVIAGRDDTGGIRGFAPEAEVFAFKIFPGGRSSSLIEALDRCIESRVDVVNLSLGSAQPSELVRQKIAQARAAGVACVAAAGNSSGAVLFPAAFDEVLAVGAIGQRDTFPPESYHSAQVLPNGDGDYFAARFSCFGPQIDVCAPGVAVISTVPPGRYTAMDGTSMAAPHVTGLAALVLAHHPDFQRDFSGRDARRVDRLFAILKGSATPLHLDHPGREGAGLPDARRALALGVAAPTIAATPAPRPAGIGDLFGGLDDALRGAGFAPAADAALAPQSAPDLPVTRPSAPSSGVAEPAEEDLTTLVAGLSLQREVAGILVKLRQYLRQYRQLADLTPQVTAAVRSYTAGDYARALTGAYGCYAEIRKRLAAEVPADGTRPQIAPAIAPPDWDKPTRQLAVSTGIARRPNGHGGHP